MQKGTYINGTATVTEVSNAIAVANVFFISNDNVSTGDLYVSFDTPIATGNYLVLKPGDKFEELGFECGTVYYKASTGSVNFRIYGKKLV
jgi:hypothetical protein